MIKAINNIELNNKNTNRAQTQNFKGVGEAVIAATQVCESIPMLNVAVTDMTTAIVPRTIIESKTNAFAGFEAFRRESSGLLINCMLPGFLVAGIAKLAQKGIMGKDTTDLSHCFANSDTINLVSKTWATVGDEAIDGIEKGKKARVYRTFKNILENTYGVDGKDVKSFEGIDFSESIKTLTDSVFDKNVSKNQINEAFKKIAEKTGATQNIKINTDPLVKKLPKEYFTQDLGSIIKNSPALLKELTKGEATEEAAKAFAKKATKLVRTKSLGGLALILPLAVMFQPINRWITEKKSGVKGAPIYKDFGKEGAAAQDKTGLTAQKVKSIGLMLGISLLSIMKMPSKVMFDSITQFKGLFPSMDQARIISTATFASRMGAAQDKNDLREATLRDITTFSALYFLGDYVAKGMATVMQKVKGVTLLNDLKPLEDGEKNVFKKIAHWTKDTALKSSEELVTKDAKKLRSICQLGNLGFSLLVLGIIVPTINRKKTEKQIELQKQQVKV
ncbi:MAG: hypothetical protein MJ229_03845 [bacterium]|nr:hypothetical protein [bacterium]